MEEKRVNQMIAQSFLTLADMLETGKKAPQVKIAVTAIGSEHGEDAIYEAAKQAADNGIAVYVIGTKELSHQNLTVVKVEDEEQGHKTLESLLEKGEVQGGVTMHYPFPIGVSTVGRVVTPARGSHLYLATTTGTASTNRVAGMVKNAIYGIVAAKACGTPQPTVGILNVDGARQTEIALNKLKSGGYDLSFAESKRQDGGSIMRGNDLLNPPCDVMVTDSLTGNILMKMFSAYTTGGNYEATGYGYGPGIGDFSKLILIISRASGTPVIRGAIEYAAQLAAGEYQKIYNEEMKKAERAGLSQILKEQEKGKEAAVEVKAPPAEVATGEISGIDIMDLEDAVQCLWAAGIYASSGMGCTGPLILVPERRKEQAREILTQKEYIGK